MLKYFYELGKKKLFPLNRSITGEGTSKTLKIIKNEFNDLKILKIRSGKKVYDWKIPMEWNVKNAFILDKHKKKIVDFKKNNLHLVGYSQRVNKLVNKEELFKHLHTIPEMPNAIPYVTSYYKKYWGFCLSEFKKKKIELNYKKKDYFRIFIDSKFNKKGYLKYGELLIKGKSTKEILVSTYICHPSMANNELSGPIVSLALIKYFKKKKDLNKSIRFLFIPETIGSITYINKNLEKLKKNVVGGFNLSCIGDERMHSCILSKYGDSPSDHSLLEAYKKLNIKYKKFSFLQRGSDERQFNSPGIDIPITSIFRTKYGEYKEYHTSFDDFNFVTLKGLTGGYKVALAAIKILDKKIIPKSSILCEPFLSKRNLKPSLSRFNFYKYANNDILHFLQYADGKNDLSQISSLIKLKIKNTKKIYNLLKLHKLIDC